MGQKRITVILGNGFDIALGLKTGYKDFYRYFLTQNLLTFNSDSTPCIDHPELIEMIESNKQKDCWADLELLLGKNVNKFVSIERLREEKIYLEEELNQYLRLQQDRLHINEEKSFELTTSMDSMMRKMMNLFNWEANNVDIEIQFITFNYTDTIDRIVKSINNTTDVINQIALYKGECRINYRIPMHIHGSIDDCIVLGVNEDSQYEKLNTDNKIQTIQFNDIYKSDAASITNKKDESLKQIMEKPVINDKLRSTEKNRIQKEIMKSDKIMIFGSSIGETDSFWWKMISDWLCRDNKSFRQLGIFVYDKEAHSPSAVAQLKLTGYADSFREKYMNKELQDSKLVDNSSIIIKKCEDWMFSFGKEEGVEVSNESLFQSLIK